MIRHYVPSLATVELSHIATPRIRPCRGEGNNVYVVLLNAYGVPFASGTIVLICPFGSTRSLRGGVEVDEAVVFGSMATSYSARGMSASEIFEALRIISTRVVPFH